MGRQVGVKLISPVGQVDVKLENLSGKAEPRKVNGKEIEMKADGSPKMMYKNSHGEILTFAREWNGQVVQGTTNCYVNDKGVPHTAAETTPHYIALDGEHIPAQKFGKDDVFEIKNWCPESDYTDASVLDKFYQVSPSKGKSKTARTQTQELNANTASLKKLYDYMKQNGVIGKGKLNVSSTYLPTVAYIRAVDIGKSQWTVEIGLFKQKKQFTWLEEKEFKAKTVKGQPTAAATEAVEVDEL